MYILGWESMTLKGRRWTDQCDRKFYNFYTKTNKNRVANLEETCGKFTSRPSESHLLIYPASSPPTLIRARPCDLLGPRRPNVKGQGSGRGLITAWGSRADLMVGCCYWDTDKAHEPSQGIKPRESRWDQNGLTDSYTFH